MLLLILGVALMVITILKISSDKTWTQNDLLLVYLLFFKQIHKKSHFMPMSSFRSYSPDKLVTDRCPKRISLHFILIHNMRTFLIDPSLPEHTCTQLVVLVVGFFWTDYWNVVFWVKFLLWFREQALVFGRETQVATVKGTVEKLNVVFLGVVRETVQLIFRREPKKCICSVMIFPPKRCSSCLSSFHNLFLLIFRTAAKRSILSLGIFSFSFW